MAKNQMTGKVAKISDTVSLTAKNGQPFNKRELILDCTTYDRYTGEPTHNYVLFEFIGKNCDTLNGFKKDDMVTISFSLQGSVYQDKEKGQNRVITHVYGYECVRFVQNGRNTFTPQTQSVSPQVQNAPPSVDAQSPFPPQDNSELAF